MNGFINSKSVMRNLKKQVLGGVMIPHSCSMPVLREEEGNLQIAFFVQFHNKEQLEKGLLQRPAYWYLADMAEGFLNREINCYEEDFCKASFDKLYEKGSSNREGTKEDIETLYELFDDIRLNYLQNDSIDRNDYEEYLKMLFDIIPVGQLGFYKELSKIE